MHLLLRGVDFTQRRNGEAGEFLTELLRRAVMERTEFFGFTFRHPELVEGSVRSLAAAIFRYLQVTLD